MSATRRLRPQLTQSAAGLTLLDMAAAAALSLYAVALTSGTLHTGHRHGGIAASVGVLGMTLPVAWRRRAPLAAAAILAASGLLNGSLFGSMVRCGAALPAVFLVAFAGGARSKGTRSAAVLALCAADVAAQAVYDPQLGARVLVLMLPITAGFFALGGLIRSRTAATEALRLRSAELRRQREQTARLAVLADRARVAVDLDGMLHERIGGIATTAAAGRQALAADPATARQALVSIEHAGRELLRRMREAVGMLQDDDAPREPQPALAQLSELLSRATTADARLTVKGSPRILPAGLELSGYRIVEHLLLALEDAPAAAIDVGLCFGPDALELRVSGPPARRADLRAVLAAASERAALHGGTVDGQLTDRLCQTVVRLPLISSHA